MLRVDERVWEQPALVDIVLHMVHAYMVASQADIDYHVRTHAPDPRFAGEARQTSLKYHRASAIVQVLLELCRPDVDEAAAELGVVQEVRAAICAFVHQVFVALPLCIKLVHFQTYALPLLRITVPGIPSMHTCADYVAELVAHPDPGHRVFGVHLAATLCMQYPVPKSLDAAHAALAALSGLSAIALAEALPALPIMCTAFPALAQPITALLVTLKASTPHQCDTVFSVIAKAVAVNGP